MTNDDLARNLRDRTATEPFVGADATMTIVAGSDLANVGEWFAMPRRFDDAMPDRGIVLVAGAVLEFGIVSVLKTWCPRWEAIEALGLSTRSHAAVLEGLDLVAPELVHLAAAILEIHTAFVRDPKLDKFDNLPKKLRNSFWRASEAANQITKADGRSLRDAFATVANGVSHFLVMHSMHYAAVNEFIRGTEASPTFSKFLSGRRGWSKKGNRKPGAAE